MQIPIFFPDLVGKQDHLIEGLDWLAEMPPLHILFPGSSLQMPTGHLLEERPSPDCLLQDWTSCSVGGGAKRKCPEDIFRDEPACRGAFVKT